MRCFVFQWREELNLEKYRQRLQGGNFLLPFGFFLDLEPGIIEIDRIDRPVWIAQNLPDILQGKLQPYFLAEDEIILERTCWRNIQEYQHQQIYATRAIGEGENDVRDAPKSAELSNPALMDALRRVRDDWFDTISNPWKPKPQ